MPQACQTCNHPKRVNIDRELITGKSVSSISRKYGLSEASLYHHRDNHLTRQLSKAMEIKQATESMDLLNRIEAILAKAEDIFNRNYDKGRDGLALKALSEQRSTLELLAKIAAYLHEARAAELEATQQQEKEKEKIDLSCLNDRELVMFHRLINKVKKNDPSIVVLRDRPQKPALKSIDQPSEYKDIPSHEKIDSRPENPHSTPVYEEDSDDTKPEKNPLAIKPEPYSSKVRPIIR